MLAAVAILAFAQLPDPTALVQTALRHSNANESAARSYSMTQETVEKKFDAKGATTGTEIKTFEVLPLFGEPYARLIRRDGKPLEAAEERKEAAKLEEARRKRAAENAGQRTRRLREHEEKLARQREMLSELPKAFTFQIEANDSIDGHEVWVIAVTPRPDYKAPNVRLSFLNRMQGRIYISKAHERMMKVDVYTTAPVSFGWVLAKVGPGTRITIEQTVLPDGVWVTKRFNIKYDVKIAALKQIRGETEQKMWNFRRLPG